MSFTCNQLYIMVPSTNFLKTNRFILLTVFILIIYYWSARMDFDVWNLATSLRCLGNTQHKRSRGATINKSHNNILRYYSIFNLCCCVCVCRASSFSCLTTDAIIALATHLPFSSLLYLRDLWIYINVLLYRVHHGHHFISLYFVCVCNVIVFLLIHISHLFIFLIFYCCCQGGMFLTGAALHYRISISFCYRLLERERKPDNRLKKQNEKKKPRLYFIFLSLFEHVKREEDNLSDSRCGRHFSIGPWRTQRSFYSFLREKIGRQPFWQWNCVEGLKQYI